jgi:hypothetical protein
MAGFHTRRGLEHWHPDDGPLDEWLAGWAEQGFVPEYSWDSTPIVVNGRTVLPWAWRIANGDPFHVTATAKP